MRNEFLAEAIKAAGGPGVVGAACNITSQAVSMWLRTRCPAEHVLTLERLCGAAVTRYQLRPDIYPPNERAA